MPFCTSCGKEVAPGKKFCEYCGAPLEQPAAAPAAPTIPTPVPPATLTPPVTPASPSGGSGKTIAIAGIVVMLLIIAGVYFFGLPAISGSQGTGTALQQSTPLQTMAPVTAWTVPASIITGTPVSADGPAVSQTYEERYTETYNEVYFADHAFSGGQKEIFPLDVITPPLYIKFNITPKMYFGEKTVDIGLSSEHIVNATYTSPNAWFKVKVYDADNGDLIEEQGFNKEHGIMTKQEFMVRAPGNYRVEMSGNDVIAEIRILTGKA